MAQNNGHLQARVPGGGTPKPQDSGAQNWGVDSEYGALREYGFWANVNPEVPHPRWSQASERVLGTSERVATQLFNGYGAFVAELYAGMENEKLFM